MILDQQFQSFNVRLKFKFSINFLFQNVAIFRHLSVLNGPINFNRKQIIIKEATRQPTSKKPVKTAVSNYYCQINQNQNDLSQKPLVISRRAKMFFHNLNFAINIYGLYISIFRSNFFDHNFADQFLDLIFDGPFRVEIGVINLMSRFLLIQTLTKKMSF